MRLRPDENPPAPTTLLGDWYCNLLHTSAGQLILAVSERTLLPVLVPARDAKSLPARLPQAVAEVFAAIGVPSISIGREVTLMDMMAIGRTASRQVLGSMNDFAWMLEVPIDRGESLLDAAVFLAQAPCKPIGMDSPSRATLGAFALTSN